MAVALSAPNNNHTMPTHPTPSELAPPSAPSNTKATAIFAVRVWIPLLALLLGMLATLLSTYLVNKAVEAAAQLSFTNQGEELRLKIEARMQAHELMLVGGAALFESSTNVTRSEFKAFATRMLTDHNFPGQQSLGYAQLVPKAQLARHTARMRKEGFSDYTVRPAGERDAYTPVVFLEPENTHNLRAIGFDLSSQANRRAALDLARDSGRAVLTEKLVLVQEAGSAAQPGVLMYSPVYRKRAVVDTVEQRRAALVGWVTSPFRTHDLIANILKGWITPDSAHIRVKVYDGTAIAQAALLFDSAPGLTAVGTAAADSSSLDTGLLHSTIQTQFHDRTWTLAFDQIPGHTIGTGYRPAWLTFAMGTLVSLLLFLLSAAYQNINHQARRIARRLTQALQDSDEAQVRQTAIFNSANFSGIATDAQGVIQFFNVGAERMLGYAASEVVNQKSPADLSDPQEVIARARTLSAELDTPITPGFEALVFKASHGMEDIYELTYICKDGSRVRAVVSVTALRDAHSAIIGYLLIGIDNTARKADEETLAAEIADRQAVERLHMEWTFLQSAALEVCANAVLIVDIKGMIQWANPAFCKLSGYGAEEVVDRSLHDLVNSGAQDKPFYMHLWHTILSGRPWQGELVNRRKDGTFYDEEMTITPVSSTSGTISHFIVVKQDITEHKRVEAIARAANQAKSIFLANMSHEIRTPMNGVIGMVDILQQTKMDLSQQRMLSTVQRSAQSLLSILNDILDFSKIEAGKLDIEFVATHLRELAESVTQLMVVNSASKRIDLSVYVSPALPHYINTDPTRLRQILLNLLGNAIKFTPTGLAMPAKVTLHIEPGALASGQPGVLLRVVDSGIGMSAQVQLNLFQPFTQADESVARNYGGTGLGLSICQRLVELMGGRISVRSAEGEGSEFTVVLPLLTAPAPGMPVFGPSLAGVRVLCVIDDTEMRDMVDAYCQDAEAEVTAFADLGAVRQHLAQAPPGAAPAVLLLGLDTTGATSATSELALPAGVGVVCLERGTGTAVRGAFTVGAYPLYYRHLIRAVAFAGERLAHTAAALESRTSGVVQACAPTVEQAAASQCLILLAEDNETNRDVIQLQLRLLGYASEAAEDGAVALEMWRTGRYALLLTDCNMPHMDGFALTEAIRQAEPMGTRLPIVAITANAMQGEADRCLARGMDDYLSKPMRMENLSPMLMRWLPKQSDCGPTPAQAAPRPASQAAAKPASSHLLHVWHHATLGEMVGDDASVQRGVLEKYLRGAESQLQAIAFATANAKYDAAADLAHALKSSSRMVGAVLLGELAEAMETAGADSDAASAAALVSNLKSVFLSTQDAIRAHIALQA